METIKQFTEQKIKEYVDILNIQMTKENTNEIDMSAMEIEEKTTNE